MFLLCVCVHVSTYKHSHAIVCMWKSEDNLKKWISGYQAWWQVPLSPEASFQSEKISF